MQSGVDHETDDIMSQKNQIIQWLALSLQRWKSWDANTVRGT